MTVESVSSELLADLAVELPAAVRQQRLTELLRTHFRCGAVALLSLDGSGEAHPYYVRTSAPDAWLKEHTADTWDNGVVTGAVNTYEMLAWAKKQLTVDPSCFIAGIR